MSKLVLKTPNLDVAQAEIVVEDQASTTVHPGIYLHHLGS